jgi:hypothetical protein
VSDYTLTVCRDEEMLCECDSEGWEGQDYDLDYDYGSGRVAVRRSAREIWQFVE